MSVIHKSTIADDVANLLATVHADVTLGRAAFAGEAFRINDEKLRPSQTRSRFSEELVLRMIDEGLLYACQAAEPWVERGIPARPFSVRLTKDGLEARRRVLLRLTVAVNDDGHGRTGEAA